MDDTTPKGPLPRAVAVGGAVLRLRLIEPADAPRLIELYARLSRHTAYQRFFSAMQRLPTDWAHFLANVDYQRRLAIVIEHDASDGPAIIAVGRYEPTADPVVAEVAFVVEDGWQGKGLGLLLLDELLAAAKSRGVQRFRAYVLADNARMLGLLRQHARVISRTTTSGVAEVVFEPQG